MKLTRHVFLATILTTMLVFAVDTLAQTGNVGGLSGGPSTNNCNAADKLEVTAFSINPAQPASGQAAQVKLTIKNKCAAGTAPITFNWDIAKNSQVLAEGSKQLNPGSSTDFTATWTATVGSHNFYGGISTNHTTLGETQPNAQNNTRDLNLTITTPLVTQLLNHVQAKDRGFRFTMVPAGPTTNICVVTAVGGMAGTPRGDFEVGHYIMCNGYTGGKADFESFGGMTLQNGWRVKSYEVVRGTGNNDGEGPGKGWNWASSVPSGTNPSFKIHLWVDGGRKIYIGIKLTIEGPQGTSPY